MLETGSAPDQLRSAHAPNSNIYTFPLSAPRPTTRELSIPDAMS
jgi:hypothetical protein